MKPYSQLTIAEKSYGTLPKSVNGKRIELAEVAVATAIVIMLFSFSCLRQFEDWLSLSKPET